MFTVPFHYLFLTITFILTVEGFCGDSIRWAHRLNIEDVYGMWYGVGYAQHTPDMTNKPNEVGCVTLHIIDVTTESQNDWRDLSVQRNNNSSEEWRSDRNNPLYENSISGSTTDVRIRRKTKRDIYNERRLRVIWDEDGQTVQQTYVYTPDEPGLWIAEQLKPFEREMMARGINIWKPDDPPKHPQVVRILDVTDHLMLLNHCSDIGGGVFSLILRRSPSGIDRWQWYDYKKKMFNFDLPNIYRYTSICAGCVDCSSLFFVLFCISVIVFTSR